MQNENVTEDAQGHGEFVVVQYPLTLARAVLSVRDGRVGAEGVTTALGIEPTRAYASSEEPGAVVDVWTLRINSTTAEEFEEQFQSLMRQLKPLETKFALLRERGAAASLDFYGYASTGCALVISAADIAQIHLLGLSVTVSISDSDR
jgi:Domain of unknown function (DUF4279)